MRLTELTHKQPKRPVSKTKIKTIGPYTAYRVNAAGIRDASISGDQFNDFATHLEFPQLIPDGEIWISTDVTSHELPIMLHNGINQYEAKAKGIKDWYGYALRREKSERQKADGLKFRGMNPKKGERPPDQLYSRGYCHIGNTTVWLVDAEMVRDLYKTDFILGGNHEVYAFVPAGEIWVEDGLADDEVLITILHEYVESVLMHYRGMSYDRAHDAATTVDFKYRRRLRRDDITGLSPAVALRLADQCQLSSTQ